MHCCDQIFVSLNHYILTTQTVPCYNTVSFISKINSCIEIYIRANALISLNDISLNIT